VKVAAVVVNWNGGEATRRCLSSLRDSLEPMDLVVVDNASTDGSVDRLAEEFPQAWILLQAKNLGFCDAVNAGARYAERRGADAIFLVNNDAWVDRRFLAPLLAELADPTVAAAGPMVLFGDDPARVWCLGGRLRFRENVSALIGFGKPAPSMPQEAFDCDYLPGCALLVRLPLFRQLGGLDSAYFAYMEDVDFGVRLREAGHRLRAVPDSRVYHRPSTSTGGGYSRARKYANALNSVRFLRRHGSRARWAAFVLFDVAGLPLAWAREALRRGGDPAAVAAKARGLLDGLRGGRVTAETFARFPARAARP
jgi:GT2 family glycosyltransferase